jgi:hypothetical protein
MHEREKSVPAIGAGKPTNKTADAAEPVEQRAGAKGNASEQSTHRTQGRERVSQALERVRKAARLRERLAMVTISPEVTQRVLPPPQAARASYVLARAAADLKRRMAKPKNRPPISATMANCGQTTSTPAPRYSIDCAKDTK